MRVLHTADWHLGKKLGQYERTEEHVRFISWFISVINEQNIDVVIISGDLFDTGNPSNATLKLYYDFLWQIKKTSCKQVIIIGGNHDSVATLNAPKDLLQIIDIHIVGGVPENIEDQIIPVRDESGDIKLVVCAVPFLRDRDLRLSVPGESIPEQEKRIKDGIISHYTSLIQFITGYKEQGIPVLATGHLFAAGSHSSADTEKEIHVGNLGQVSGTLFPTEFDYIALGHMHRPQLVNKMQHIRYSGSPIPLSFSENNDDKIVIIAEVDGSGLSVQELRVPLFRRLIRIKGGLDEVKKQLYVLENPEAELSTWVEVQIETEMLIHDLEEQLRSILNRKQDIELIFVRQNRIDSIGVDLKQSEKSLTLTEYNPISIFELKCKSELGDASCDDLMQTFREAIELMTDDLFKKH